MLTRGGRACLALLGLALSFSPVLADDAAELKASLRSVQASDALLQSIGYRIAHANWLLCADKQLSTGLQLTDVRNYSEPERIRAALGITGDFAIEAIAARSTADNPELAVGAEVISIEGKSLAALPAKPANDAARIGAVHDLIDAALAERAHVRIGLASGKEVELSGEPICRSRFELATGGSGAQADGRLVQVSRAMLLEGKSEDQQAWVVAHELAHNVLRHRARLAAEGRSESHVLATEREADRLAVWLMANAGYDPAAAPAFLRSWGRKGIIGALMIDPNHDSAETRARAAEAEIAVMEKQPLDPGGQHDWRTRFTPYTAPAKTAP